MTKAIDDLVGAVFFANADGVSANRLLAKLREDGKLSRKDPRKLSGFGKAGDVGIAIHPPRRGYWAVTDSADGGQGIGVGEWSRVALIANHLGTHAIWYRAYSEALALAVRFDRGGSFFRVAVGKRARVAAWLDDQGIPLRGTKPPSRAGKRSTVAAIKYARKDYRCGPSVEVAGQLLAVRDALIAGDPAALRARCADLGTKQLPLGLGVIRATEAGAWRACLGSMAEDILRGPTRSRTQVKEMILEEEILRPAAEIGDEDRFPDYLDALDAIEADAARRSEWAHPGGVARLAHAYTQGAPGRAFACYRRLLARSPEPHWIHCNQALYTLLISGKGEISIDGDVADAVRRVEARLPALGEDAQNMIRYNLAAVYSRAGDLERAKRLLGECLKLLAEEAPHPERDPDFAALWDDPDFRALVRAAESYDDDDDDDDDERGEDGDPDEETHQPPPDRAVSRLEIALGPSDESAFVNRLGGRPHAPSPDTPWPESPNRPMQLIFQLVGRAGGGELELGDIQVLQVFADLEGDYYHHSFHRVVAHRAPCPALVAPPVGCEVAPVKVMTLTPGSDDRILLDLEWPDEDHPLFDAHRKAYSHAWIDKLWGIPIGANLDDNQRDSKGHPMTCLVQLTSYDDWFLWYLFVSPDFSETRLRVVRG